MDQIILELEPKTLRRLAGTVPCFRLSQPRKHKMHLLRETYFSCFNVSNVLKNFVQV